MRKALEDPQSNVCSNAIYALEKLYDVREKSSEILGVLRQALKHTNSYVHLAAIDILIQLPKIDSDDLEDMVKAVVKHFVEKDSSSKIFQQWYPPDTAFQLLLKLSSKSSDPRIEKALQKAARCRESRIFEPAMQGLSQLEEPSEATFDVLGELAIDPYDWWIREKATSALAVLPPKPSSPKDLSR